MSEIINDGNIADWYANLSVEEQKMIDDQIALDEVINQRRRAYGDAEEQLEFLSENGVDAFIERVNQIKSQYPKPE